MDNEFLNIFSDNNESSNALYIFLFLIVDFQVVSFHMKSIVLKPQETDSHINTTFYLPSV
uniref:Uncharacterized protein n=1 Tax=Rhizophagus irregularis (strain DAOM 181602 / DAOM 197198 / MUCL 43194) TaxID=747089 RepID=U9T401_RHIID